MMWMSAVQQPRSRELLPKEGFWDGMPATWHRVQIIYKESSGL